MLTYNRPAMLTECLDSVLPVPADWEVVVVDDASSDRTAEVIQSYANVDSRIRYERNERNLGTIASVNRAFSLARGKYVVQIADDDSFLPRQLQRKVNILDRHPDVDLVWSRWYTTDEDNLHQSLPIGWAGLLAFSYLGGRNEFIDLFPGNYVHGATCVYRRELWEQYGGYDEKLPLGEGADWDMWLRYFYHGKTAFLEDPGVNVRFHDNTLTSHVFSGESRGAEGKFAIWRKWLFDPERPLVLGERVWRNMGEFLFRDLQNWYREAPEEMRQAVIARYRSQFHELYQGYVECLSRRFALGARRLNTGSNLRQESSSQSPPIVWSGAFLEEGAEALDCRAMVTALSRAGLRLRLEDAGSDARQDRFHEDDLLELKWLTWVPLGKHPFTYIQQTQPPRLEADPEAAVIVCRTSFPAESLPSAWVEGCSGVDMVWVPSRSHADVFANSGVSRDKLRVLPWCVDPELLPTPPPLDLDPTPFVFVSMIDDWTLEAGADLAILAFVREFRPDEKVMLRVCVNVADASRRAGVENDVKNFLNSLFPSPGWSIPPVNVVVDRWGDRDRASVYRSAHACIQSSRGRTTPRTVYEALLSERATIATAWGATAEFLNDGNGYPISAVLEPVPAGALPGADSGSLLWAVPSVPQLQAAMREVFTNRQPAYDRGARGRADVERLFGPQTIAEQLRILLNDSATPADAAIASVVR